MTRPRQQAREDLAAALERRGSAYRSAADSVRAGYENLWIVAALDAIEPLVLLRDDDDDEEAAPPARRRA